MTFFESFKEALPSKPDHLQKPLFYKTDSDALKQMDLLKSYSDLAPDKIRPLIERDMRMLQYGITGEDNVAFELNNSFLPIIVLHNKCFFPSRKRTMQHLGGFSRKPKTG